MSQRGALQADSLNGAALSAAQRKAGTYQPLLNSDGSYNSLGNALRADGDAYYRRQMTKPIYCSERRGDGSPCNRQIGHGMWIDPRPCWQHEKWTKRTRKSR